MTFPTVQNTVNNISGQPLVEAAVTISLIVPGFGTDDNAEVASSVTVYTNASGVWTCPLKPNSLINPASTYYTVSEPNGSVWTIIVPNTAGPFLVPNILAASPTGPAQGAITMQQILLKANNLSDVANAATALTNLGGAPLASPTFTGNPAAPTQTAGDSSTKLATTAFVATSFAPKASPALTGTPTAPTAAVGTNTTQIATTAYAATGVAAQFADVYQNVSQSLTNNTWTAVTMDTARYNPQGMWSSGATDRITANVGGYYELSGQVTFASSSAGRRIVAFSLNGGAQNLMQTEIGASSTSVTTIALKSTPIFLNVNDYVQLQAYQNSGGALGIQAGATFTAFTAKRIGG